MWVAEHDHVVILLIEAVQTNRLMKSGPCGHFTDRRCAYEPFNEMPSSCVHNPNALDLECLTLRHYRGPVPNGGKQTL
jgi:hypothetical protein